MGYLALYRKYRPRNFDDLVGQDSVSSIIKNEILNDKIFHAYLFSGPRGTGKTSTAKIIAKMINCSNLNVDGTPCGECENCLSFDSSSDIVEIDAASNNGVDEIRNLRDKVNLVPTCGKYKIYIIDEVHMLTTQAFNALLKTLEEPPSHVVFILATTEFYKIPATVVSRCQKFQFLKFSNEEIVSRLSNIATLEKINVSDEILYEIARLADGGLRDAINMLDQLSAFNSQKINIDDLYKLNGVISYQEIANLLMFVYNNSVVDIVCFINELDKSGKNLERVIGDLIGFLKDVLIYKNTTDLNEMGIQDKKDRIMEISNVFSVDDIYDTIFSLNDLINNLKNSNFSVVLIVTYFIKLSNNLKKENVCADNKSLNKLDNGFSNLSIDDKKNDRKNIKKNIDSKINFRLKKIRINNAFATASKDRKNYFIEKWSIIKNESFLENYDNIIGIIDDIEVLVVGSSDVIFLVKYNSLLERVYTYVEDFESLLFHLFDSKYNVVFLNEDEWYYERSNYISNIKSGKKYHFIEENMVEKNDDLNNESIDDLDKIVSILGKEVISYKN